VPGRGPRGGPPEPCGTLPRTAGVPGKTLREGAEGLRRTPTGAIFRIPVKGSCADGGRKIKAQIGCFLGGRSGLCVQETYQERWGASPPTTDQFGFLSFGPLRRSSFLRVPELGPRVRRSVLLRSSFSSRCWPFTGRIGIAPHSRSSSDDSSTKTQLAAILLRMSSQTQGLELVRRGIYLVVLFCAHAHVSFLRSSSASCMVVSGTASQRS
jgi:hypothetical protein